MYPDCPNCGGTLEYYDHEIISDDENTITIRYRGWCVSCHNNYQWKMIYEFKGVANLTKI